MAIGINWAEIWGPVWKAVWTQSAPAPAPAPAPSRSAGGRRNYIVKGKRYFNITNEELAYLIARDLIDVGRDEIKVTYKNKKPHMIPKTAWNSLNDTLQKLETLTPKQVEESQDDDDDILLL